MCRQNFVHRFICRLTVDRFRFLRPRARLTRRGCHCKVKLQTKQVTDAVWESKRNNRQRIIEDCTLLYLHEAKYLYFVLYERKNERTNERINNNPLHAVSTRRPRIPQLFSIAICAYPCYNHVYLLSSIPIFLIYTRISHSRFPFFSFFDSVSYKIPLKRLRSIYN